MNLDLFSFTYYYGNGDYYTGQGYAEAGTYAASQVLTGYANETGYEGYYTIDSVVDSGYDPSSGYNNYVSVNSYYDYDASYFFASSVDGYGYSGLGSEYGTVTGLFYSDSFSNYDEADIDYYYPPTYDYDQYNFTYYYGNGDSYSGYGYASVGTYYAGQTIGSYANETGYDGYYYIDSVYFGSSYDYIPYEQVSVTGYYDGDTSFSSYSAEGYGYSGLGSESGTVYSYSSSDSFSTYDEADLYDYYYYYDQYNFTYYYGNGDSYSGYGYASAGTYYSGQTLDSYWNETGNYGYYIIDSVYSFSGSSDGEVYVNSYYDGDTSYSYALSVSGYGYSGLGSESGTVSGFYSSDSFSNYDEADLYYDYNYYDQYNFTYYYGNGDSYSGYGYASAGTYYSGQNLGSYWNETGNYGYYIIDSVYSFSGSSDGEVYVNSYYDGDTSFSSYYAEGYGYSGLGSESGTVFGYYFSDSFSYYDEADLDYYYPPTYDYDQYNFTYYYGNGDSYSGYGYASVGTYYAGQTIGFYANETGYDGYYYIDSVYFGSSYDYIPYEQVYVHSYYDGDTSFSSYSAEGYGYSGLGSESGTVYGYYSSDSFSNYDEADLYDYYYNYSDQYSFTYYYGNGDSYSGYGYALTGTYYTGQTIDSYWNETGNYGYYIIDFVYSDIGSSYDEVYVTSYYDGDTGYGYTSSVSGSGYYGLGSESGYAYNANNSGDNYFSNYHEADLPGVVQVRLNLLADDGGTPGELIANDQIGVNKSFFVEILVADLRGNAVGVNGLGLDLAWDGFILESINFDPALAINPNFVLLPDGSLDYDGLISNLSGGSLPEFELGQAIGINQLERFALLHFYTENSSNGTSYFTTTVSSVALADDASYSLDVEENQPIEILSSYNQYNFTYNYGNGDFYTGYVYALEGTYAAGQVLEGYYNETGNYGSYTIDSISSSTFDSWYNNQIYITSYYDGDTGYGYADILNSGTGYSGLTSEYGWVYDANWSSSDSYFDYYNEADILGNQLYTYTYHYGNGDSYSGYGYAAVDTYTVGQTIDYGYNETGNYGYYTIDSVELGNTSTGYNGYVYITSYTDADTGFGTTTNLYNYGNPATYSGLGNEASYAYDFNGYSSDSYFSNYYEADILNQYYTFTYSYGNGDSYSGYGYALAGTYAAEQVFSGYWNETGNEGYYTINSVSTGTTDSYYNNRVYITSYTDGDTGYGTTTNLYSYGGGSGLGSEYGYAYDSNWYSSDSYFDYYSEADILGNQLYNYTYHYGNGDSYSGYGYAAVGTYTAGQELSGYWNETGNYGYYTIDSIELGNTSTGYNGYIYVTSYYDADTGFGTAGYVNSGTGYYGLTSEYGYAYDSNGYSSDSYFSYYSEADILNQYYTFTYTYGNGDSYSGYGYALAGTYAEGQTIDYGYNETGNYGYYTINSVSTGTADSWYNNQVYVTSYYDGDTGYGYADLLDSYTGYSGLGSEYGYAYDSGWSSSDSYFDRYYEADILGNQLFNYTYHYGNGDSYSGYGYAAVDTYTAGQTIDYGYNETGNYGYYTIDSVELGNTNTGYNGYVYITSYTDDDTSYAYGTTTYVGTDWGYPLAGIYGLGSEYGWAYTAEGTSHDSYFSNYYEADLTVPSISITDNSGDIFDASIKFTTELSKFRKNYLDSDFVRPNYADSSKYFDITNTGTGLLTVSDIQINVAGVTTDLDLTAGDLLLNPNESQRVQLTYTAAAAKEVFDRSDALVLFTNALDLPEFAIALSGKSTFNSDINYDGIVGTGDLGPLNQARVNYNKGILDPTADINGDGIINTLDVKVLSSENKKSVFV